jgi:hypothetical protein
MVEHEVIYKARLSEPSEGEIGRSREALGELFLNWASEDRLKRRNKSALEFRNIWEELTESASGSKK